MGWLIHLPPATGHLPLPRLLPLPLSLPLSLSLSPPLLLPLLPLLLPLLPLLPLLLLLPGVRTDAGKRPLSPTLSPSHSPLLRRPS